MSNFQRLVRFEDTEGNVQYGELDTAGNLTDQLIGLEVTTYDGTTPWSEDLKLTENRAKIAKVLCPIPQTPIVIGIGINYKSHAIEGGVRLLIWPNKPLNLLTL